MERPFATQAYVTATSLAYDEVRQRYIAQVTSRSGVHTVESPDRAGIDFAVQDILNSEYMEMMRAVEGPHRSRVKSRGSSHARAVVAARTVSAATQSQPSRVRERKLEGRQVSTHAHGKVKDNSGRKSIGSVIETVIGGVSLLQGNWLEAGLSALSIKFQDWFEGVESLWDKSPKKTLFAVSFGGVLITAGSRRQLKKKLQRQKNKRIQKIMNSIRYHHARSRKISSAGGLSSTIQRLKQKHEQALGIWRNKVYSNDSKSKSLNLHNTCEKMRGRIHQKRQIARKEMQLQIQLHK